MTTQTYVKLCLMALNIPRSVTPFSSTPLPYLDFSSFSAAAAAAPAGSRGAGRGLPFFLARSWRRRSARESRGVSVA
jgi:hypothetical protein